MKKESNERLRPRGIIGCLTVGFEMLTQSLSVVALPIVLDLILWLGPRISVGPLLRAMVPLLVSHSSANPEVGGQVQEAVRLLELFGERFNLLSVLGGIPLFQVPSLLARRAQAVGSPLGDPRIVSVSSVLALVPWWGVLALVGLILGFLYLNEIAHQVNEEGLSTLPATQTRDDEKAAEDQSLRAGLQKLLRFLLFAFGLIIVISVLVPLWTLMVALGASIAQPLGVLLWVGGMGLLSYAGLHLLFVIPSIFLGGRRLLHAIGESVVLSHVNLSSVLGFVLLAVVIYEGLGYAWSLPSSNSWAMLIGIMGNAFVATGLTSAIFVFYRDRLVLQHWLTRAGD